MYILQFSFRNKIEYVFEKMFLFHLCEYIKMVICENMPRILIANKEKKIMKLVCAQFLFFKTLLHLTQITTL